jgi:oligopeptide transport system permease protein
MSRFILRRLAAMLLVLWVVSTLTFVLMKAIPGGPFTAEKRLPPEVLVNLEARYRLNDPLWKQYRDYLWNLVRFDLGPSFKYEDLSVNDIIRQGFPVSAGLGVLALSLALLVGVPTGLVSALRQYSLADYASMLWALLGVSIPSFLLATLFIYVFGLRLHILPAGGWGTPAHALLPAIALGMYPTAFIARLTRSSMLEVIRQDYVRTARAKGLAEVVVTYRHALKNAVIPVVTYLGPITAAVLTGSFVVERIFAIPGLGRHFVTSIYNRDYTVIMGTTVFYSVFLVAMNLLVDVAYGFIDPRIRFD